MRFLNLKQSTLCAVILTIAFTSTSCALIGAGAKIVLTLIPLKLALKCLPEGTLIDTPEGPRAIETLSPGDTVIGFDGKPVKVQLTQGYVEDSTAASFMTVEFTDGSKVDLCDEHRIHDIRAKNLYTGYQLENGQTVKSITVYDGVERSYDILTEDKGYQINGVPVNSMIEEMYETGRTGKMRE